MQMRLAFAVAAQLEPETLLVDEVLAVGDLEFQKKCLGKMSEVSKGGRTIVFVSHQMSQIRRLCERVIWVDSGVIKQDGPTLDVVSAYERVFTERTEVNAQEESSRQGIQFLKWELVVEDGAPPNVLQHFDPVSFRVVIRLTEKILKGSYAILLFDDGGRIIWHGNHELSGLEPGTLEFLHRLPTLPIKPGAYRWKVGIYDGRKWTDPWWALPELIVGTKPLLNSSDEFMGVLNLSCDMEIRTLGESYK
jgi:lipopolysaccharide transport system ATP-binding protein